MDILWVLSMVFEQWFAILVANIMSDPVIVLTDMLQITFFYSTDLTHNSHNIHLSGSTRRVKYHIKRPLKIILQW